MLSVHSAHTSWLRFRRRRWIACHIKTKPAGQVVVCAFSAGVLYLFNVLCSLDLKIPDILLSVQGKHNLPLRGRCINPFEKTSWGLRKEKRGQRILPPPRFPSLSPVNATTQAPLTSQEVDLCTGSASYGYPAMLNYMVADCRLQGGGQEDSLNITKCTIWGRKPKERKWEGKKETEK